jgi:bifunctional non-homologous end joining protein LigD
MIFDLDPPEGGALAEVRFAARAVHDRLAEVGLESRLMTTGSRGYHVVVPLARREDFDVVRAFAKELAGRLAERHPGRLTVEPRKAKREGRVFLDYLRNGYAQTAVAPYAVRARPGAPVATPLDWDELGRVEPGRYTLGNLFQRLGQKDDPWKGIGEQGQSLSAARRALGESA